MRTFFLLLLGIVSITSLEAQKKDIYLEKKLNRVIEGFRGHLGLYVKNLETGGDLAIHADTVHPTASMIKVPILIGIMDKLIRNELEIHEELKYHDSLLYPGVDILGSFRQGEKIELSKLMMLMMTMSDNTASIWLQQLAGGGERINQLMDSLGFPNTKVNSRTKGRELIRERYGWGQTTAREMAKLFEMIYRQKILSPAASTRMLRFMNRNYWDGEALSMIPPNATVFSKNGALNEYRGETVLVRGFRSQYVFCIITNNIKDTTWNKNNEAWTLIRKVSSVLWNHFEPAHPWAPPTGSEMFY